MIDSMTRRRLLGSALAGAAAATCARSRGGAATPKVLIVGAGMAGIAAGRKLNRQGFGVTLIEARDRIGGRIWTERSWPGLALDLGASWIHGTTGNPLTTFKNQFGMETRSTNSDSITIYDTDGRELRGSEEDANWNRYRDILRRARQWAEQFNTDRSLQSGLDHVVARMNLSGQELKALNYSVNSEIEHDYGGDASDLSIWWWDQDRAFDGPDVLFPNGYDVMVNGLAAGLEIRLSQVARRIEYGDFGVRVITDQTTFSGDYAIVTLPFGVLKADAVEFSPDLPSRKARAIRKLKMGILNKVYLRFPEVFWDSTQLIGYMTQTKGEWAEWYGFQAIVGAPVLLGFNAATHGLAIEQLTDEANVAGAMTVLRTIYGSAIPNPTGALITRWGADPFARGSYSHIPPGAHGRDYDTMATPVQNRLFFAGEATHRKYPQTVHGAFLSGEREANRIASL